MEASTQFLSKFLTAIMFNSICNTANGKKWYLIYITYMSDTCRFHIDRHGPGTFQVFFKTIVVFPYPSVRRVDSPGPVIFPPVTYGGRDGAHHREAGATALLPADIRSKCLLLG